MDEVTRKFNSLSAADRAIVERVVAMVEADPGTDWPEGLSEDAEVYLLMKIGGQPEGVAEFIFAMGSGETDGDVETI